MDILIVPSIRESCIKDFIKAWNPTKHWDHVIVVEDNPNCTFDLDKNIQHVCWDDIKQDLQEDNWIISHRDSAIKCYGTYLAYKIGANYIYLLDDDCYPCEDIDEFIYNHKKNLEWHRWTESVPGCRTRGFPYANKGLLNNVVLNHGLWNVNPDLDACQSLVDLEWDGDVNCKQFLIPQGQYFPMCAMNVCFRKNVAPLMYFPLMGESQPYRRFDDIWCGVIMKKICDHLRFHVSCGGPLINHIKASDPFVNLVKEAPGISTNEWFWEKIDIIELTEKTPILCMIELGKKLQSDKDSYISKLGEAIQTWSHLFQSIE